MTYNRIAIFGHRGWVSSAIVAALAVSGAPITVLYRPTFDTSSLPNYVKKVEVDLEDETTVIMAFRTLIFSCTRLGIPPPMIRAPKPFSRSLAGLQEVQKQLAFVKATPHTDVKLFCPSALAAHYDEQGLRIPDIRAKHEVEVAA
ncbi:hypothetical protein FALBO_14328 [Fusarium albosuccineum]|uniref:NmrA-like domain-containing protein n=1 Tax=Fusarium albosuccineum TaxID=1237068 RepID=A0A8H4L0N1_9HYPO|nr:hypothetical protein FALBO_14328 [Fusarium albosuccineum]